MNAAEKFFRWLYRCIKFIFIISIPIVVFVIGIDKSYGSLAVISLFALSFILFVYTTYGIVIWLKKVFSILFGLIFPNNSGTALGKTIAFGLTGYFYGLVPVGLLFAVISFSLDLLNAAATLFNRAANSLYGRGYVIDSCERDRFSECARELFVYIIQLWADSIKDIIRSFQVSSGMLYDLVNFVIVWAILSHLVCWSLRSIKTVNANTAIMSFYSRIKETFSASLRIISEKKFYFSLIRSDTVSNIAFFSILFFALYLSLAAIAAIPSLQNKEQIPEAVSVDKLEARLNDTFKKFKDDYSQDVENTHDDKVVDHSPHPLSDLNAPNNNPIIGTKEKIENDEKKTIEDLKNFENVNIEPAKSGDIQENQSLQKMTEEEITLRESREKEAREINRRKIEEYRAKSYKLKYMNSELNRIISSRNRIIQDADNMNKQARIDLESNKSQALSEYQSGIVEHKGNKETIQYFRELASWYEAIVAQHKSDIQTCLLSIKAADQQFGYDFNAFESNLRNYDYDYDYYRFKLDDSWESASEKCGSYNSQIPMPNRPSLGSNLGPFGPIAGWLLSTESLPLALITGLLGFGLLGSACSTFVREHIAPPQLPNDTEPLVKDLPKVIIIGFSAAILAFLSVMGGLAVFFSSGSEPNPYALLLTCLIAAACGEDIWEWARRNLQKRLEDQDNNQNGNVMAPEDGKCECKDKDKDKGEK